MSSSRLNATSTEVAKLQKRLQRSRTALKFIDCLNVTIVLIGVIGAIFWGAPLACAQIFSFAPPFGNSFLLVPIALVAIIFCGILGAAAGIAADFALQMVLTEVIGSWQEDVNELPREIAHLKGFGPSTAANPHTDDTEAPTPTTRPANTSPAISENASTATPETARE